MKITRRSWLDFIVKLVDCQLLTVALQLFKMEGTVSSSTSKESHVEMKHGFLYREGFRLPAAFIQGFEDLMLHWGGLLI
jgi:hypothetical protein